ncbi:hypothetical protein ACFOMD_09965 [Sphingoaurantiacus capsulatus]|uniref:Transposase n=1 Tax=Sphingoaurantiacus capsulatus TaxID=1771310 RepID=A0ABV7XCC3_9SPHN
MLWSTPEEQPRQSQATQPVSLFQFLARSHPPRVMMYVKYPLLLRNVEDLLHERGIDICHETVRFWRNRFGPMFAAEILKAWKFLLH